MANDGQNNRFDQRDERRRAARAASNTQDQREQARESQRADWTHTSDVPRTPGGIAAGADLAALKAASDADRAARRNQSSVTPAPVSSWRSLQALVEFWQRNADNAVNFYESEFNYTSLTNCVVTLIFGRGRPATVETVAEAFAICLSGNHLELLRRVDSNGATIRKRGDWKPQSIPPTVYPAYIWPAEVEAATVQERENQMAEWLAGKQIAQARPFAELQAEVRRGFKTPRHGSPNLDRTY